MSPRVTVERDGHLLLIGVDRVAERNAWDLQVIREVGEAYDRLGQDDEVRVGVVHGHGDHFSAGLDLAEVLPAVAAGGHSCWRAPARTTRSGCGRTRCPSRSCSPRRRRSACRGRWPTPGWPRASCRRPAATSPGCCPGVIASEDAAEGVRSAVERREARSTGR